MTRLAFLGILLLPLATAAATPDASSPSDYSTAVKSDYVFACMTANGGTREALQRCACSIDVLASLIPYDVYERTETILRMRQGGGYLAGMFHVPATNDTVRALREAQAEAEVRCF